MALSAGSALAQATVRYPGDKPNSPQSSIVAPLPHRYVCYGNSIFNGACSSSSICAAFQSAIPGATAFNESVSGYTAAQIRTCYFDGIPGVCDSYETACGGTPCQRVLLGGPVNSLKAPGAVTGVVEQEALEDELAIVDHALSQGWQVVWTDGLPYSTCAAATCPVLVDAHQRMTTYNTLKAQACAARSNNPLLKCVSGLYELFEDQLEEGEDPEEHVEGALSDAYACADDHIHLKNEGTDLLKCRMLTMLGLACP